MAYKFKIECPHCKTEFPMPLRRHIYSEGRGAKYGGFPGTLCGKDHGGGKLIVKPGETVNCRVCLVRQAKGLK